MNNMTEKLSTYRVASPSIKCLGRHISYAASLMQSEADARGCIVLYDFNGKDLECRPGEDSETALNRWAATPWPKRA